jgi:mannose-6-phosphate isomerase-like protein (cupin superfamily)
MAGWFVVDVADSPAVARARGAVSVPFDRRGDRFPDHGICIRALEPGQPSGLYHAESLQEDFLVLGGECIAIIDGQEQRLAQWSFLHCPAGTAHVFVGAGEGPCWILMAGPRRPGKTIHYPSVSWRRATAPPSPRPPTIPRGVRQGGLGRADARRAALAAGLVSRVVISRAVLGAACSRLAAGDKRPRTPGMPPICRRPPDMTIRADTCTRTTDSRH